MTRNDFLNMIGDKATVNRQMVAEVYELTNIFPYFQSAHMLLLLGMQNNGDVKFNNQLRTSAIHIADRGVLYYLLKSKPSPEVEPVEVKPEVPVSEDNLSETQQTVIESAKNSEDLISKIEKNSGDEGTIDQPDTYSQDYSQSILISNESDDEDPSGVILIMEEETTPGEDKIFYMDPGFSVTEKSDLLELDLDDSLLVISEETEHDNKETGYEENNSKNHWQSELIDKFIIANPRIGPVRDKTDLPIEDISKSFVEEQGGFVTETLAGIYINQGYYSKAIDIYEKLSLKFPEKSSYFASQIEKVKEFIKK
jgi:hypothetical protein